MRAWYNGYWISTVRVYTLDGDKMYYSLHGGRQGTDTDAVGHVARPPEKHRRNNGSDRINDDELADDFSLMSVYHHASPRPILNHPDCSTLYPFLLQMATPSSCNLDLPDMIEESTDQISLADMANITKSLKEMEDKETGLKQASPGKVILLTSDDKQIIASKATLARERYVCSPHRNIICGLTLKCSPQ
jgi:hypothetical protein